MGVGRVVTLDNGHDPMVRDKGSDQQSDYDAVDDKSGEYKGVRLEAHVDGDVMVVSTGQGHLLEEWFKDQVVA